MNFKWENRSGIRNLNRRRRSQKSNAENSMELDWRERENRRRRRRRKEGELLFLTWMRVWKIARLRERREYRRKFSTRLSNTSRETSLYFAWSAKPCLLINRIYHDIGYQSDVFHFRDVFSRGISLYEREIFTVSLGLAPSQNQLGDEIRNAA